MIEMHDIYKSFGTLEVLKGISLSVAPHKITSIVGPSGAGKTTLLQILGTIERPDKGRVLYDGTDVNTLSDNALSHFRNANIGFVFQYHRLLPELTMLENIALPAMIGGASRSKAYDRARDLARFLGLTDRLQHRPAALSGGECQRAAVARAIVNSPAIVLADEPTGSLDSENRNELYSLFFDLRDKLGTTMVIITHDNQLAALSDKVLHLLDGRLKENK